MVLKRPAPVSSQAEGCGQPFAAAVLSRASLILRGSSSGLAGLERKSSVQSLMPGSSLWG